MFSLNSVNIMKTLTLGFAFCFALVNGAADYQVVPSAYAEGASVVKYPQVQLGAAADTLRDEIISATTSYVARLTNIYYFQANSAAFFFGHSVEKMTGNLDRSINSIHDESPADSLDHSLDLVSNSFEGYIDIIPQEFGGNAVTGSTDLPSLENLMQDNPVNVTSMQTLESLLHDLPAVADHDFSILQKFITSMFAHGWENARPAFIKLRDEFREDLLFDNILSPFRSSMMYVHRNEDIIKAHTSDAAWSRCMTLFDKLTKIVLLHGKSNE
ncbi:uncharacterized protein LOC107270515 [Cephus cinctus]|uniref:Uncharacterized protein LOC107270515 n=1 Tax=Cephus cinctus TaxID=211228 RepID=A0AAJ7C4I6_CEPCN|nr:uncharacterized protein LOC107270515 [Cephus cinctus]